MIFKTSSSSVPTSKIYFTFVIIVPFVALSLIKSTETYCIFAPIQAYAGNSVNSLPKFNYHIFLSIFWVKLI